MPNVLKYCKNEGIELELRTEARIEDNEQRSLEQMLENSYCLGTTIPLADSFRLPIVDNTPNVLTATLARLGSHFKLSDTTIMVYKPIVQDNLVNEGCVELLKKGLSDHVFTFEGNCRLVVGWIKTGGNSIPWAIYPKDKTVGMYGVGLSRKNREWVSQSSVSAFWLSFFGKSCSALSSTSAWYRILMFSCSIRLLRISPG